ncbi:MAG: hypothetical protein WD609_03555 [Aquisalimonadaceae bacterium]
MILLAGVHHALAALLCALSGLISSALTAPAMAARAFAPIAAAALWTATGSYNAVLAATLAAAVILTASFWAAAAWSLATTSD